MCHIADERYNTTLCSLAATRRRLTSAVGHTEKFCVCFSRDARGKHHELTCKRKHEMSLGLLEPAIDQRDGVSGADDLKVVEAACSLPFESMRPRHRTSDGGWHLYPSAAWLYTVTVSRERRASRIAEKLLQKDTLLRLSSGRFFRLPCNLRPLLARTDLTCRYVRRFRPFRRYACLCVYTFK